MGTKKIPFELYYYSKVHFNLGLVEYSPALFNSYLNTEGNLLEHTIEVTSPPLLQHNVAMLQPYSLALIVAAHNNPARGNL